MSLPLSLSVCVCIVGVRVSVSVRLYVREDRDLRLVGAPTHYHAEGRVRVVPEVVEA